MADHWTTVNVPAGEVREQLFPLAASSKAVVQFKPGADLVTDVHSACKVHLEFKRWLPKSAWTRLKSI
jgi:hypothetical protein